MTTTVTVTACCADSLQVVLSATGSPDIILQNGESTTAYAYDNRVIRVKEVSKSTPVPEPVASDFKFQLNLKVKIKISGEMGAIAGRAEYATHNEPLYFLKYVRADGVASEGWWYQSDIEAV